MRLCGQSMSIHAQDGTVGRQSGTSSLFSCDCRVLEWLERGFSYQGGYGLGIGDHFFSAFTGPQQDGLLVIVSWDLVCFHDRASASCRALETA